MKELKKFKVQGSYKTQYFVGWKPQTYREQPVISETTFDVTIYRENIAHAIFTLFEQHHRSHRYSSHRFDEEVMITLLDLESLQIVEVK